MMTNQVDSLDEQILAALQENGRLTMKSLAEQVGLSSPAMIERVRRLEERDMATLEKIVDDLSETGARCQTTVVLSSPVPYRPITPPEGLTVQRSRLARRRRKSVSEDGANGEAPKRPGRPRGRPPAAV
jgi:lambda repressor-like predicted transcriptional regulator